MNFDFDNFVDHKAEEEQKATLEYLTSLGDEAVMLQSEIDNLNQQVDELNTRLRYLTEKEMPRCFRELNTTRVDLSDGTVLSVKEFISGTLNRAPDREFAIKWCEDNGFDELFTVDVGLTFPRGDKQEALVVREKLEQEGYAVEFKEGIHPQTFASNLRKLHQENEEKLKQGIAVDPIPFEQLGAYHGIKAEMKMPKKKK